MDGIVTRRCSLAVALLVAAAALGGCSSGRLQSERDALWRQNQELQDELTRERSAKDAALADRDTLAAEVQRLQSQTAPAPVPVAPVRPGTVRTNTAFSGIEGVETEQRGGNVYVRVPGDVLFAPGKVDLKSTAQKTLDQIASVIQKTYPGSTIRVEGYTDTDPIRRSNWADNLQLSMERAASVYRYLQKKGVDPDKMYAAGFGEHRPRATKPASRRVEIVVVAGE